MLTKILTPSPQAIELFKRLWYQIPAGTERKSFRSDTPTVNRPSAKHPSANPSPANIPPGNRLPQEIVDMIITYLTHDILSLRACSFTSRSWYIAAVPRLHRTLAAQTDYITNKEVLWPKPLRVASKFGFLPFVTRVVISGSMCHRFSTKKFNKRTRREFSQLTNVQKLSITALATPSFTPRIREYFWQFSSTLRSLTLANAEGSGRHVVFFIGLFPHLEDLRLLNCLGHLQWNQEDDLTLVLSFVPSLRGGLTVHCCRDGIVRAIIDLFGEIRFRHMDLVGCGIQQLVYACPNTLETLKLDAIDICGTPALDLDLSRNKSLRKLEITAKTISMY